MSKSQAWLSSLRLRTLPLALSCIGMGAIMAINYRLFNWHVLVHTALTAILLQILSNLANDYGDAIHGADSGDRVGPKRGLQNGEITLPQMRNAIIFCALLTLVIGVLLLHETVAGYTFIIFLLLGLLCIAAAIRYTVGKKPYGYSGFGDIAVFIFFGLVGVVGTFYLFTHGFKLYVLLPACTMGFLSTGVLNINNMRDHDSDLAAGKRTMVVRIGLANARKYHAFLITAALVCITWFALSQTTSFYPLIYLITVPLFLKQLAGIMKEEPKNMDKYLKQLSLTTLLLVISFGAGIILQLHV